MKRIVLFLFTVSAIAFACSKSVNQTLSYTIVTVNDSVLSDIYVPVTGTYDMPVQVKFLTGNPTDVVSIRMTGVPARIKVKQDTFTGVPTFIAHFAFTDSDVTQGTYPVTITSKTANGATRDYTFNMNVIPADCASSLVGTLTGHNSCKSATYSYTATGITDGVKNKMTINNFGGYGPDDNAKVVLDCTNGTLTMASQTIGNGVTVQGSGTFTASKLTINYTAVMTPGGFPDNCVETLTK
jgi:hypothetical protein